MTPTAPGPSWLGTNLRLRADISAIDDQIRAINAAGGLEGILQGDDHMKELAADAYAEEMKALDSLEGE